MTIINTNAAATLADADSALFKAADDWYKSTAAELDSAAGQLRAAARAFVAAETASAAADGVRCFDSATAPRDPLTGTWRSGWYWRDDMGAWIYAPSGEAEARYCAAQGGVAR